MSLHQNRHEGEAAGWLKALQFASENVMYLCLMCVSLLFVCMYNYHATTSQDLYVDAESLFKLITN